MKPRFIGNVNFAPMDPSQPERWQLEEPYAQVTSDGYLAIARPWRGMNGASIPRLVQLIPGMGHPFERGNKFWFPLHDQGYTGDALVIRLSDVPDMAPETFMERMPAGGWVYEMFEDYHVKKPRRWFDAKMVEAMKLIKEPLWKRIKCWAGVRIGGWRPWNKARK